MRIVIAGGHGKIGLRLGRLLAGRGDTAIGLIRNPDHAADLREAGVEPRIADLERISGTELAGHLAGADAVVFSAGAGPGSGIPRKDTVDRAAASLLADAAAQAGVRRYLLVSAIGLDEPNPDDVGEVFAAYLDAKRAAENDLRGRDLDWTVLRPGRLTDDPGTGRVSLGENVRRAADGSVASVPRDDVADALRALLDEPRTARTVAALVSGDMPVDDAVAEL